MESAHTRTSVGDEQERIVCEKNGMSVEVRSVEGGFVVVIKNGLDNKVEMQSRAAAIWLEVK